MLCHTPSLSFILVEIVAGNGERWCVPRTGFIDSKTDSGTAYDSVRFGRGNAYLYVNICIGFIDSRPGIRVPERLKSLHVSRLPDYLPGINHRPPPPPFLLLPPRSLFCDSSNSISINCNGSCRWKGHLHLHLPKISLLYKSPHLMAPTAAVTEP